MNTIDVLLAVEPRMLSELLRSLINAEPDLRIADAVHDPVDLLLAVKDTGADVVVLTVPLSDETPPICTHLLSEFPGLVVIVLYPEVNTAVAYRNSIDMEPLSGLHIEDVVSAIRTTICSA